MQAIPEQANRGYVSYPVVLFWGASPGFAFGQRLKRPSNSLWQCAESWHVRPQSGFINVPQGCLQQTSVHACLSMSFVFPSTGADLAWESSAA